MSSIHSRVDSSVPHCFHSQIGWCCCSSPHFSSKLLPSNNSQTSHATDCSDYQLLHSVSAPSHSYGDPIITVTSSRKHCITEVVQILHVQGIVTSTFHRLDSSQFFWITCSRYGLICFHMIQIWSDFYKTSFTNPGPKYQSFHASLTAVFTKMSY